DHASEQRHAPVGLAGVHDFLVRRAGVVDALRQDGESPPPRHPDARLGIRQVGETEQTSADHRPHRVLQDQAGDPHRGRAFVRFGPVQEGGG
ncbi:hypothetical protein ABTN00_20030, partial [Acinetobacter baumannii]